jgi:hypothetical protein
MRKNIALYSDLVRQGEGSFGVMGEDLGELFRIARSLLQNGAELVVKRRSIRLRQRTISGVAYEEMAKGELVVVAAVVADQQSLSAQRFDGVIKCLPARHVLQLAELESLTDDTRCLQHILFRVRQAIESSRQDSVDALRHTDLVDRTGRSPAHSFVDQMTFIDQHVDELFAEERRAGGTFDDLGAQRRRKSFDLEQLRDEGSSVVRAQRIERDGGGVRFARAPVASLLEELGARNRDDEDGGGGDAFDELVDDGHDRLLRPLEVVHHHNQGSRIRERLQVTPNAPDKLAIHSFGGRVRHHGFGSLEPLHHREPCPDRRSLGVVTQQLT